MLNPYFISRHKCVACNSSTAKEIYNCPFGAPPISDYLESFYSLQGGVEFEYLTNANFTLFECAECGMIFQKEIPNDELMAILYEKWIDPNKAFDHEQRSDGLSKYTDYAQEIASIIAHFQTPPSELSFLDFGMGWGKWAQMVKAFGCNSYGTDLSENRAKYAESNGVNVITWDEIADRRFDFINTEQVFEHISNPLDTLIYLKGSLKDDGLIKISVPTAHDIDRRLKVMDWTASKWSKNSLNAVAPLEHINYFRRSSLLKMAALAGMKEAQTPKMAHPMFLSKKQYVKRIVKALLWPAYRSIAKKNNYLFLRMA